MLQQTIARRFNNSIMCRNEKSKCRRTPVQYRLPLPIHFNLYFECEVNVIDEIGIAHFSPCIDISRVKNTILIKFGCHWVYANKIRNFVFRCEILDTLLYSLISIDGRHTQSHILWLTRTHKNNDDEFRKCERNTHSHRSVDISIWNNDKRK